ncbi:MAG: SDR family NAD(P)-dependent oxidoreductase [Roseibium sp.]|nr:SDR family NAD(P)-dependent oxidoreductase [Roseibium sp.]
MTEDHPAKVVMISGGGRGLGAAITRKLLEDGWTVSLGLRDLSQAAALSGAVSAHPFDASDPATAPAWVEAALAEHGRIDALVNNAGILRMVDFEQGDEDDLDALWSINVKAPFRLIKEALPHLRASGRGRVVNIASTDAKRYRTGTSVGYAMTKHALLAMTQAVRHAAWEDGVRATALCPGAIDTELIADLPGVTPKADRMTPETVAGLVAMVLALPNQASVPELIANTRLESLI